MPLREIPCRWIDNIELDSITNKVPFRVPLPHVGADIPSYSLLTEFDYRSSLEHKAHHRTVKERH